MIRQHVLWPWHGLLLFLKRPRWWWNAVLGSTGGILAVIAVIVVGIWWYWPSEDQQLDAEQLMTLASRVITALVGFLAVVLPLTKHRAGRAVLRPVLASQGIVLASGQLKRPFTQQLRYLLLTASWRIFWLVAVVTAAWNDQTLGLLVGLWALGHLLVTDACDQVLLLRGRSFTERRWALAKRSLLLLLAGGIAGAMAGVLGLTVFGWLVWAPAIFVGAAHYVAVWDREATSPAELLQSRTDTPGSPNGAAPQHNTKGPDGDATPDGEPAVTEQADTNQVE